MRARVWMVPLLLMLVQLALRPLAASASVPPKLLYTLPSPLGTQYYLRGLDQDVARVRTLAFYFGMVRVECTLENWEDPAGRAQLTQQLLGVASKLQEKGSFMLLAVKGEHDPNTYSNLNARFASYCGGLAQLLWDTGYRDVIFELWNEPNIKPGFEGDHPGADNYASLVNAAATAIQAGRDIWISTGGVSAPFTRDGNGPHGWSLIVMQSIDWSKVSFFGYHSYDLVPPYPEDGIPEMIDETRSLDDCIAYMRECLSAYVSGRDVLMTERGWSANHYNDTKRTAFLARLGLIHIRNAVESNVWFHDRVNGGDFAMPDAVYDAAITISQHFGDNPKDWANKTGTAESQGVSISGVSGVQSLAREVQIDATRKELRIALWLPLDHVGTPQYATLTIPAGYTCATYLSAETGWDDPNRIHVLSLSGNQVTGVPISGMPIIVTLRQTTYWGGLNDGINSYIYPPQTHDHTMTSGQTETFQVELRNWGCATWEGEGSADPVMVRIRDAAEPDSYFRAPDWLPINPADPIAAAGYVAGPVATNGTVVLSWGMKAPAVSSPTTYHEELALYSVSGECRINHIASWDITVLPPSSVDYVITSISRSDAGARYPGETIEVSWQTANNGVSAATAPSLTSLYLSTDAIIDPTDTLLHDESVPALAAGAADTRPPQAITIPADTSPGAYYLGAMADRTNAIPESDESNNTAVCTGTVQVLAAPYSLSLTGDGCGSVLVNGESHALPWSGQFPGGTEVTLAAVPCPGWQFDSWSGDVAGSQNPVAVALDSDKDITAHFSELPYDHVITVSASADPQTVESGGAVYLSATASDAVSHQIASWEWTDSGAGGTFYPGASVQSPVWVGPGNPGDADLERLLSVTVTCSGDPPASGSASTVLTEQPERAVGSVMPIWRALLLVYRSIDADYTDSTGTARHLATTLPEDQVLMAQYAFRQFPAMAHDFSQQEALIDYDVVFVDRALTSLASCGVNQWWPSPTDTRAELDLYAPPGTYDSVFVHWPQTDFATEQSVPSPGWGLAMGPTSSSNGATYVTVANAQSSTWTSEPNVGEVWLHEWLHGVCSYYAGLGYPMPAGDADGGSGHGYIWSPTDGWGAYYRDLMTGHVLDDGSYRGITAEAWRSGSILGTRAGVFADYFCTDTTAVYQRTGTVGWNSSYGIVDLGTAVSADNRLYTSLPLSSSFTLTGRLFIPASGVGYYDSVAVAVRDAGTEYWATLAYGDLLTETSSISIMENDSWGTLYPLVLTTGWYTVRALVDYETGVIRMKAWCDGTNEPDWQTSRSIPPAWLATGIGFRHYGTGTSVDDLFALATATVGRYTLSIGGIGSGWVRVNGVSHVLPWAGEFDESDEVVVEAVPDTGSGFGGWSGDVADSRNPVIVNMDSNKSIIATFVAEVTLSVSGSHGQVEVQGVLHSLPWSGSFAPGTDVTLEALPSDHYRFKEWSGDATGAEPVIHVAMDQSKSVTAHFVLSFTDVPEGHWAYSEVAACVDAGTVQGYPDNTYQPGLAVTRDQMAVYVSRALAGGDANVASGPATATFEDVATDHWAFRYVEYCYAHDVVEGYSPTTYAPDVVVDRGQMAVYVARAVAGGDGAVPEDTDGPTFADVTANNEWVWCYDYVEYCAGEGIVQGYWDGTYRPGNDVTRDQMAVYVARAFQLPM